MLRGAAGAAPAVAAGGRHGRRLRVRKDKISIQLYTLRNLFEADAEATRSALADIGYRKVEMAGTYRRSAAEFRAIPDRNHIRATSAVRRAHQGHLAA